MKLPLTLLLAAGSVALVTWSSVHVIFALLLALAATLTAVAALTGDPLDVRRER